MGLVGRTGLVTGIPVVPSFVVMTKASTTTTGTVHEEHQSTEDE